VGVMDMPVGSCSVFGLFVCDAMGIDTMHAVITIAACRRTVPKRPDLATLEFKSDFSGRK